MLNNALKISALALICIVLGFTSCTKDGQSFSDFSDEAMFLIESETRTGKKGCYELVFPITLSFSDGTTTEVDGYDAFREVLKTWKEEGGEGKPTIEFPYEIINQDGEVITVESREQMIELKKACKREMGICSGKACFTIDYPITIVFPDGATAEVDSRRNLKNTVRAWKRDNPDAEERPTIQFPILVTLEDGTSVEVNSKEELKALKEDCNG